jgi:hypothetical protein
MISTYFTLSRVVMASRPYSFGIYFVLFYPVLCLRSPLYSTNHRKASYELAFW